MQLFLHDKSSRRVFKRSAPQPIRALRSLRAACFPKWQFLKSPDIKSQLIYFFLKGLIKRESYEDSKVILLSYVRSTEKDITIVWGHYPPLRLELGMSLVSTASSLKNTPKKLMIQKLGQRDHFGNAKQFEAQLNTTAGSKKFPFFRNKVVA